MSKSCCMHSLSSHYLTHFGGTAQLSCQVPAPAASLWAAGSQDMFPSCSCNVSQATVWNRLPHHGLHHGLQWNLGPGAWVTYSFSSDLGVCRSASLTFCLTLLCRAVFCPFLNKVYQRRHHVSWAGSAMSCSGPVGESLHQLCPCQHCLLLSKPCHINTILPPQPPSAHI